MWGLSVGDIKKYQLTLNSSSWLPNKYTECRYQVDDNVYQQVISNGFMQDPNFYINKESTSMISKMILYAEAKGT